MIALPRISLNEWWGVVFAAVLFAGCSHTNPEPIQIGHIAPESGSGTPGEHARRGVTMAVEELTKSGELIHGRGVVVRHVDSRGTADVAHAQAVRLITLNHVVALLGDSDPAAAGEIGLAAKPYAIPVITSANVFDRSGDDAPFSLGITAANQGRALGRFVVDGLKPGADRVLIVYDDSVRSARELVNEFRQQMLPTSITTDVFDYKGSTPAEPIRNEIQKTKPGAVLVVGASPSFVRAVRENAGSASPEVSWLYGGSNPQIAALKDVPAVSHDMYFATVYTSEAEGDRAKDFAEKYRSRFSGRQPDVDAALAYESAKWLFQSMSKAAAVNPSQIHDALQNAETFDGLTGTVTLNKGHATQRPVFIMQIKGQEPKLIKTDQGS
jgi:branched-chain amino acid transport system substrate-binding protein